MASDNHSERLEASNELDELQSWFEAYKAVNLNNSRFYPVPAALVAVFSDVIDEAELEEQINQAVTEVVIQDGLCTDCRRTFENWPVAVAGSFEHITLRSCHTVQVEAATRRGCKFCAFLLTVLADFGNGWMLDFVRKLEKRLAKLQNPSIASISLLSGWAGGHQALWWNPPGNIAEDMNTWLRNVGFSSDIVPPSALIDPPEDCFDLASSWARQCLEDHSCSVRGDLEWPTRLIYIGDHGLKLVHTSDYASLPPYATLSYCWGKDDFIKLKQSNIEAFRESVPFEDLPRTFQDAVIIAIGLQLRHIWIDALCIIQEVPGDIDWLKESGLMRSIYGGGVVNIAASSTRSARESLFSMPTYYRNGVTAPVTADSISLARSFYPKGIYEKSTSANHLASRAWTLQERLLAPRTLYVGETGIFWECQSMIASQFLPTDAIRKRGLNLVIPQGEAWNWGGIVQEYSKRALTNPNDKLPALSGIARRQHEETGCEYLAGMWKDGLEDDLGWRLASENSAESRPTWRAPSWSWASIDGPVFWHSRSSEEDLAQVGYIKVLDVGTIAIGPDRFGSVQSAHLRLGCTFIIRAEYRQSPNEEGRQLFAEGLEQPLSAIMDTSDPLTQCGHVYMLPLYSGYNGVRYGIDTPDDTDKSDDINSPGNTMTVQERLIRHQSNREKWIREKAVRGLLLQQVEEIPGRFTRIGAFNFRSTNHNVIPNEPEDATASYDQFMRIVDQVGAITAEAVCIETRTDADDPSRAKYVIDLE